MSKSRILLLFATIISKGIISVGEIISRLSLVTDHIAFIRIPFLLLSREYDIVPGDVVRTDFHPQFH
jgi:hypothetical protein